MPKHASIWSFDLGRMSKRQWDTSNSNFLLNCWMINTACGTHTATSTVSSNVIVAFVIVSSIWPSIMDGQWSLKYPQSRPFLWYVSYLPCKSDVILNRSGFSKLQATVIPPSHWHPATPAVAQNSYQPHYQPHQQQQQGTIWYFSCYQPLRWGLKGGEKMWLTSCCDIRSHDEL